ncbi:MAG: peptidoglycan-binding domain-containing protein [Candidatus Acidiferrum sp.]
MQMRRAKQLALTLIVAVGMSVGGTTAAAQATKSTRAPATKHRTRARRGHSYRKASRRERGQKAPTPERISEIQSALAKDGSFGGTPNGKWDAATVDSMKKFQDAHGLSPTGKLDAKTLQKLGLGSQTAGVAAPLPPVSSSSLVTSPPPIAPREQ